MLYLLLGIDIEGKELEMEIKVIMELVFGGIVGIVGILFLFWVEVIYGGDVVGWLVGVKVMFWVGGIIFLGVLIGGNVFIFCGMGRLLGGGKLGNCFDILIVK